MDIVSSALLTKMGFHEVYDLYNVQLYAVLKSYADSMEDQT